MHLIEDVQRIGGLVTLPEGDSRARKDVDSFIVNVIEDILSGSRGETNIFCISDDVEFRIRIQSLAMLRKLPEGRVVVESGRHVGASA